MDKPTLIPSVDSVIMERLGCSRDAIEQLCKKYQIAELSVFGSIVRDDFCHNEDDVDFLVVYEPNAKIGWIELPELMDALSALVKRRIDLFSKKWLRPHWRDEVVPTSKLIYQIDRDYD